MARVKVSFLSIIVIFCLYFLWLKHTVRWMPASYIFTFGLMTSIVLIFFIKMVTKKLYSVILIILFSLASGVGLVIFDIFRKIDIGSDFLQKYSLTDIITNGLFAGFITGTAFVVGISGLLFLMNLNSRTR